MANPVLSAFPDGDLSKSEVREWLAKGFAVVKLDAAEVPAEDYSTTPYHAIFFGGSVFVYDSTDTTTAHDGLTCLVSSDGRRYKVETQSVLRYTVDDKDTTAQPASPTINDAYLLPAAPTGDDWAAKGKHIGIFTARGWVFLPPATGQLVFVTDETTYYHYDGTSWVAGLGSLAIADSSVTAEKLKNPLGVIVEAQQNDPPASVPGAGVAYIVGTVPTGAWAGQAGNIAYSNGTAYEFLTASEGAQVWNKALGYVVAYQSGSWSRATAAPVLIATPEIDELSSQIGGSVVQTLHSFSGISHPVGTRIRVEGIAYVGVSFGSPNSYFSCKIDLFVDSETTVREGGEGFLSAVYISDTSLGGAIPYMFEIEVPDASTHTYNIKTEIVNWSYFRWKPPSRAKLSAFTAA